MFELKISSLKFSLDGMANDFVRDFESSMKSFEKKWILLKGNVWHRKMEYYPKVELNERYRKKNTFSFPSHRDDCLIFLPSYTCNPMHNRCSFRKDWALFKAEGVLSDGAFEAQNFDAGIVQKLYDLVSTYGSMLEIAGTRALF